MDLKFNTVYFTQNLFRCPMQFLRAAKIIQIQKGANTNPGKPGFYKIDKCRVKPSVTA